MLSASYIHPHWNRLSLSYNCKRSGGLRMRVGGSGAGSSLMISWWTRVPLTVRDALTVTGAQTRGTTICMADNLWASGNCQSISDSQGYTDVVLEYAWLTIHGCLGISGDFQNTSDGQDTMTRDSTICVAEKPRQSNPGGWTFYIDRLKWLVYSMYSYHMCITYVYCGGLVLAIPGKAGISRVTLTHMATRDMACSHSTCGAKWHQSLRATVLIALDHPLSFRKYLSLF